MQCRLQKRDVDILRTVGDFGCLTAAQAKKLFFSNLKVCRRRLRKLSDAGYLAAMALPVRTPGGVPLLFYLGTEGGALLQRPVQKPRLTTQLSHQQLNTDLLIDIMLAFNGTDLQCVVLPEHTIRQAKPGLVPDGALLLRRQDRAALFLMEHCAGTEPLRSPALYDDIEAKLTRYLVAFEGNLVGLYERFLECTGITRFRVLFIARGNTRLAGIMQLAEQHDPYGFVWGTTLGQFRRRGILGRIWRTVNEDGLVIV